MMGLGMLGSAIEPERQRQNDPRDINVPQYRLQMNPTGRRASGSSEVQYFNPQFIPMAEGGEVNLPMPRSHYIDPTYDTMSGDSRAAFDYLMGLQGGVSSVGGSTGERSYNVVAAPSDTPATSTPQTTAPQQTPAVAGVGGMGDRGIDGLDALAQMGIDPNAVVSQVDRSLSPSVARAQVADLINKLTDNNFAKFGMPVQSAVLGFIGDLIDPVGSYGTDFRGNLESGMSHGDAADAAGMSHADQSAAFGSDGYGGFGMTWKKGGLVRLAQGGSVPTLQEGSFVVPADVVSMIGNGSTDAGLRLLNAKVSSHAGGGAIPLRGPGDGQSDDIPTTVEGKIPARVADGEAYISPDTVTRLGGGDLQRGTKRLYSMLDRVRKQAHGRTQQQRPVNFDKVL